ncbi:porin family protein [Flavobacteriaceae bacterium]|nr:porin family protein [Flavobacteriaceae bacterium]
MTYTKHLLSLLLVMTTLTGFSQNKKGDISLSITASPFPTTNSDSNDFGVIAKTGLEFHVSKNVSFQGSFFTSNNVFFKNDSGVSINSYGFVPSVQYYFVNTSRFNVFGQLGYGFGFEDLTRNYGEIENSALTIFSIGAGANYKLRDKLFLQLHLPYFNAQNITINETSSSGVAVFLGFNFKLN